MPLTYSFGINHLTDILLFLSLVLLYNCMNHSKNSEGLVDKKKSVHVLVTQSCPILCNPMDCSPPGSTVQGIFQARILEWIAIPFSRGYSQPRDQTLVSCIAARLFMFELQGSPILNKKDYRVMYENKHKYHRKLFLNEFYR